MAAEWQYTCIKGVWLNPNLMVELYCQYKVYESSYSHLKQLSYSCGIFTISTNDIASITVCWMKMSVTFIDMMTTKTHTDSHNLLVNVISQGFINAFSWSGLQMICFSLPPVFPVNKITLKKKKKEGLITSFRKQSGTCIKRAALFFTVPFGIVQALSVSLSPHILAGKGRRALGFRLFLPAGCLTFMFLFIPPATWPQRASRPPFGFYSLWLSINLTFPSRNHQFEISLQNRDKV